MNARCSDSLARGARLFAAALGLAAALMTAAPAQAEITISPLRQVVTPDQPTAAYRLSNPSRRIISGRVSWVDFESTETGYAPAPPEVRESLSAAPFLMVSPATFVLEPGASVEVKVTARDGRRIPAGERRSHLLIETGAARTPLRRAGGLETDIGVGVSTPVVLRGAGGSANARIGATRLLRDRSGELEIETALHAEGTWSPFGALEFWLTPEGGARIKLYEIGNVAAWRDAPFRRYRAPLGAQFLPPGLLEICYLGREEFSGTVFATKIFEVAPPP